MTLRRRGDDDVGEARRMALPSRAIGDGTGHSGRRHIESKDTVAIKMTDGFEPRRQVSTFAHGSFTPQFSDAVLDFGQRHNRQKQQGGMDVHPFDKR